MTIDIGLRKIKKYFADGNVCVTGLRGRGKDIMIGNVVVRRDLPYVSNVDYGGKYHKFVPSDFDCGKNYYRNFLENDIKYYKYPFPDGTDVYVSDLGVYFPSQYCNELNRLYPYMATFQAISRHVGNCNFHFNVQNLNRGWDKIREQSDLYIMTMGCIVVFGFVFQLVRVYDKYDSCVNRLKPFTVSAGLLASPQTRMMLKLQKQNYECVNGMIKSMVLIYRNKSTYNTRFFKEMLEKGKKGNE